MAKYRRPDVHQLAILVTDGPSNIAKDRTIPQANEAKKEQIEIFVVSTLQLLLYSNT